jgi:3-dehydroquinate synthase
LLSTLGKRCAELSLGQRCAIITDRRVAPLYAKKVATALKQSGFDVHIITVDNGEKAKSITTVGRCYDELAAHRLERKSFIVALGGGVVGDVAGFVAATYLRGIPFVQVPTTLLAQVDSSVGGKTGVNLKAGKNLVGAFYQPRLVMCDLETLRTLPEREYRAGLAEIIKYGIIYDGSLFMRLERGVDSLVEKNPDVLAEVIARSCEIKADVVSQDETESGLRAILNFGHTIGHAIEAISGYGKYLHGEAISIGQIAAAKISAKQFGLSNEDLSRITELFRRAGLPTTIKLSAAQRTKLFAAMHLDKKVSGGEIKFVLARKIGQVEIGQKVAADAILDAIS